jgi:hypothetical protein
MGLPVSDNNQVSSKIPKWPGDLTFAPLKPAQNPGTRLH